MTNENQLYNIIESFILFLATAVITITLCIWILHLGYLNLNIGYFKDFLKNCLYVILIVILHKKQHIIKEDLSFNI